MSSEVYFTVGCGRRGLGLLNWTKVQSGRLFLTIFALLENGRLASTHTFFRLCRPILAAYQLRCFSAASGGCLVCSGREKWDIMNAPAQKDSSPMSLLTSHQALQLSASFAFTADRMRASDGDFQLRARLCEIASRVAFLRAHVIARDEEIRPAFGDSFRRASFAVA
jgi:hypothetical protein